MMLLHNQSRGADDGPAKVPMTQYTNGRPVPMVAGRAYFIASPPWATTRAGPSRANILRSR